MTPPTFHRSESWTRSSQTARSSSCSEQVTSGALTKERNFLASAAGALNVKKTDRVVLGGWTAQESDRFQQGCKESRIQAVQARIASTFSDQSEHDPLHKSDAIQECRIFLLKQGSSAAGTGRVRSECVLDEASFSSCGSKKFRRSAPWRMWTREKYNS